ncbi:hypothetical protein KUCAC02_007017, partial [Chaenocephalus aceratus]
GSHEGLACTRHEGYAVYKSVPYLVRRAQEDQTWSQTRLRVSAHALRHLLLCCAASWTKTSGTRGQMGNGFNLARLRVNRKVRKVLIRELLFADDAALVSHSAAGLHRLMDSFSAACSEAALIIKKTVVMHQAGSVAGN